MMMEKLARLLMEQQAQYDKNLLLPQIPPIKSVKIVNPVGLDIKAKKNVKAAVEIIMKSGLNQIIDAYDYFFENPNDQEGVHQVRVRIRKFRALLAFFKPLFEKQKYQKQQQVLKELGQQFGEVRQLDVLIKEVEMIEKDNRITICEFKQMKLYLAQERKKAFQILDDDLKTNQFARELLDIWIWKLNEPWVQKSSVLDMSLAEYTKKQMAVWIKKIDKQINHLDIRQQQEIHQVRIKSKKLRYVIGELTAVLDRKTRKSIKKFEKMQDDLGYVHDVFANKDLLEQLIAASDNPQLYYEAGMVVGWQSMRGNRKIKKFTA